VLGIPGVASLFLPELRGATHDGNADPGVPCALGKFQSELRETSLVYD